MSQSGISLGSIGCSTEQGGGLQALKIFQAVLFSVHTTKQGGGNWPDRKRGILYCTIENQSSDCCLSPIMTGPLYMTQVLRFFFILFAL